MAKAGDAYISIHGDFGPLNRELRGSQTKFGRSLGQMEGQSKRTFGRIGDSTERATRKQRDFRTSVASTGRSIARYAVASTAIFGTANAFGKVVEELEQANKVQRDTNAVLKSTGQVAGIGAKGIERLADSIAKTTAVDDDAIQGAENLLLTFTNVRDEAGKGNKVFSEASQVIVDLSARFGQDLNSSAIQVGKALQDPIKGVSALRRVGVQLTEQQEEQIKKFVESGDVLSAQKVILQELTRQTAGAAAAQATPLEKLRQHINQLAEDVGRAFEPNIDSAIGSIRRFVDQIDKIVSDPKLSQEEKISKVTDIVIDRFTKAIPKMANAAGKAAPKVVEAFVKSFINANAWGKLILGGFLVSKLFGWGNIFRSAGRRSARAFGTRFIPAMTTVGAEGGVAAAGGEGLGSATGGFKRQGTRMGRIFGVALRVAAIAAAAFALLEIEKAFAKKLDELSGGGFGPLSSTSREQVATQLSKQGATDIQFAGTNTIHYTDANGNKRTYTIRKQRGGMIAGRGDGDKVPVLAEPGEGFINKRAVKALGGPPAIDRINRVFPRFQRGGVVRSSEVRNALRSRGASDVFVATAYGPPWGGIQGTGVTATGINLRNSPHKYIVAVDPSVIPLHTKMRVHPNPFRRSGDFQAEDTGGAIKGNRLDFYDWRGRGSQLGWGQRNVTVHRTGKGDEPPSDKEAAKKKPVTPTGYTYPLTHKASVIGFPYQGTHTLGNWQSDNAVDLAAPFGTGVRAVAEGSIVKTGGSGNFSGRFGGYNATLRTSGNQFFYAHMSRLNARAGSRIAYGDTFGRSGKANGVDHLHFGMEHGNPQRLVGRVSTRLSPKDSEKATKVHGVYVKGKVTFKSLLDALGQKLESKLAVARLTKRKTDDLKYEKKLLAYWKGKLKVARRGHDYQGITEAAGQIGDYKTQIRDTKAEIKAKNAPKYEVFRLGGLSKIGKWNLAALQPTLDDIELASARAALESPPWEDDITAAQRLVTIWNDLYTLSAGGSIRNPFTGRVETFKAAGTVKQQIEAAQTLKSARDTLDSLKDEAKGDDADTTTTNEDSGLADLLREQLRASQRELAIAKAQLPIFQQFANAPHFDKGGIVPGAMGQAVPIIAHGGEAIGQMGDPAGPVAIIIEEGAGVDPSKIRLVAREEISAHDAEMIRRAKSGPASGRKLVFPK